MGLEPGRKAKNGAVLWAVDPFETESRPLLSAVQELGRWANRAGLRLLPVHIVSTQGGTPPLNQIEAEMQRYLERYPLGRGVRPKILIDGSGSRRGEMEVLKQFALEEGVKWIAVSSHGRSGLERLVLGSFTERLLHESAWPLLFLARQPRSERAKTGRRVLFASEFAPFADEAFARFLPFAKVLHLDITILHLMSYPIASLDLGIGSIFPENFFAEQEEGARARGLRWLEWAKAEGVNTRFLLRESGSPSLFGKAILEEARREGARLIAMSFFGNTIARLVEGGAAHQIFRSGRFPVWLMGPGFWQSEEQAQLREKMAPAADDKFVHPHS